MGLDLALGGLVLFTAFRGWLRGFVVQAIRLAGLVAAVYAAVPARDESKPYVVQYLPAVNPEILDRLLYWVCAVVCYLVIVGVVSTAVAVSRRKPYGLDEPKRTDQFAGFGLGVIKGLLFASFLVAGLHKYGQGQLKTFTWGDEQIKQSYAWKWHEEYRPAPRIWASQPVQQFVTHVQKHALNPPAASPPKTETVSTAARTPNLAVSPPQSSLSQPTTSDLDGDINDAVEAVQKQLSRIGRDN